jgi:hypothetical protein
MSFGRAQRRPGPSMMRSPNGKATSPAPTQKPSIPWTDHKNVTAIFEELPGAPPLPGLFLAGLAVLTVALAGMRLARRK